MNQTIRLPLLPRKRILCFAPLIVSLCFLATANAGDLAELRVIGFSPKGEYFAFEQYGIHDGSGFPYSEIFIIDTASDSWVKGTPIRVEMEDESASQSTARELSARQVASLLTQFDVSQPGHSAEKDDKGTGRFTVKIGEANSVNAQEAHSYLLDLNQWEIKETRCQQYGVTPKLFRLFITSEGESQSTRILHEDSTLPRSRGCPVGYEIHEVLSSSAEGEKPKAIAVILSVSLPGHEGPNRRFLAITSRLDR